MIVSPDTITSTLRSEIPALLVVYVFGSRARGDALPDSDLDLAFLAPRAIDPVKRWLLQERIASDVHGNVDLVDLRSATTVMRVKVLESARVWFESDPNERAKFEAVALGAYARLNEERKGIVEDAQRRETVYG